MKKKVYRERYAIAKQDEIYSKEELVKKVAKETMETIKKTTTKKKVEKKWER